MKKLILLLVFTFVLMLNFNVQASHIAGGNLSYKCIAPNTYLVKATIYRDCWGLPFNVNRQTIGYYNACGQNGSFTAYLIPKINYKIPSRCINSITSCNGGNELGIEAFEFEGVLTLPNLSDSCQQWHIYTSTQCCRKRNNTGLNGAFYLNAYLDNSNGKCNNSIDIKIDYLSKFCIDKLQNLELNYTELDGDSIRFEFDRAKQLSSGQIGGYTLVNYGIPYTHLMPGSSSTPFVINPQTAMISFTPNRIQEITFVVKASEYRNNQMIGFVTIEFPFEVNGNFGSTGLIPTYSNDTITKNIAWQNLEVDFDMDILCNSATQNASDFILLDPQFQPIPIISAQKTCGSLNETNQLDFQLANPVNQFGTFYLISKLGNDTNTVTSICRQDMAENDTLVIISGFPTNTNNLTQNYQLKTFPNPTNGELQIDFIYPEGKNLSISLYNLLGTKVHKEKIETFDGNYQGILNLNHLPNQTYLLELETEKEIIRKKIVLLK